MRVRATTASLPAGPRVPAVPAAPAAPVAPVAPVAPAGPTVPTGPTGPRAPFSWASTFGAIWLFEVIRYFFAANAVPEQASRSARTDRTSAGEMRRIGCL